jgi:glycosyltransferase involved in cell wall biosynthesis
MKILMLLTKDYPTDPRVTREAESLRDAGHSVTVFSLDRGVDYSRLGLTWMLGKFWSGCLVHMRENEFDAVHAHDLDTLPIGLMIAKLRNVPLIYDAHESYVDMVEDKIPHVVGRCMRVFERAWTKKCAKVIVANHQVGYQVSETPNACDVVMNCPGLNPLGLPTTIRNGNHLRIGYFGSLEPDRFIMEAIEVVKELPDCGIVIGGSGSLETEVVRQANGNERIAFLGKLSRKQAYDIQSLCDLQLVMFKDNNANNIIGTPNRLFEAMSLGKAVVANLFTESGRIVERTDCGFVCSYHVSPFKILLEYLVKHRDVLDEKGANGLMAHLEKYNWENQERTLLNVYQTLGEESAVVQMNRQGIGKIEDEIHLTIREILWLKVYNRAFFYDKPHWLWDILERVLRNDFPQREFSKVT